MRLKSLSKILGSRSFDTDGSFILERANYVRKEASGFYNILPLGQLVLDKIIRIIEDELGEIGAYKVTLPMLQPSSLWHISGRYDLVRDEVYKLEDGTHLLAPTFEEQVCKSITEMISSYRQFPLRLFQTGPKWRLEKRPKGNLNRLREFIMNDLYTFDIGLEEAQKSFDQVINAYEKIFALLKIPIIKVQASTGIMGGSKSVEFQTVNSSGEDTILICESCKFSVNSELYNNSDEICSQCHSRLSFKEFTGLELGHCFLLGTKYTEAFGVEFTDQNGNGKKYPLMGCHGIGVSRLFGSLADIHSDLDGLKWPQNIAPFPVSLISKFELIDSKILNYLEQKDGAPILIDDRNDLSIGKRIKDSLMLGIPKIIVVGNAWRERGLIEEYDRFDPKCHTIDPLQSTKSLESLMDRKRIAP
jgi:prolyl-tRNA synthetase